MAKVLIIGGLKADKKKQDEYARSLNLTKSNHKFTEVKFDQIFVEIKPDKFTVSELKTNRDIASYDLVIFRGKVRPNAELAYVISRYLIIKKKKFWNDYSIYRPPSKLAQAVLFYEFKVPFLQCLYSLDRKALKQKAISELEFPLILKDNYGSHGYNNYFIKSKQELSKLLTENMTVNFIVQKYCPNDGDYRVLVMGDKAPLQIHRKSVAGSHLNNTSQGGSAKLSVHLPAKVLNQSRKLARSLGMTVAGIDILEDSSNGQYYFLEINSQPQLITGSFIKEKKQQLLKLLDTLTE